MKINTEDYWSERYKQGSTGWDMGGPAPALTAYTDQLTDKSSRILLPGAGRAYEAEYLFRAGFKNLTVIDIAPEPLADLKGRVPEFPEDQLIQTDFFEFEGGPFDLILEHTFFCALPPALRLEYVRKMKSLLAPKGKLAGLLFSFPLTAQGPPFGGSLVEYQELFSPHFRIKTLERATNSIPPRAGNELFFIFENA